MLWTHLCGRQEDHLQRRLRRYLHPASLPVSPVVAAPGVTVLTDVADTRRTGLVEPVLPATVQA